GSQSCGAGGGRRACGRRPKAAVTNNDSAPAGGELMMKHTLNALAACCCRPGAVDLFGGDERGAVWHRPGRIDVASSQLVCRVWTPLSRPPIPGAAAPPADWLSVTSSGTDRIELFARAGATLYHRRFANGTWIAGRILEVGFFSVGPRPPGRGCK